LVKASDSLSASWPKKWRINPLSSGTVGKFSPSMPSGAPLP
jgi:hypothetical protein